MDIWDGWSQSIRIKCTLISKYPKSVPFQPGGRFAGTLCLWAQPSLFRYKFLQLKGVLEACL